MYSKMYSNGVTGCTNLRVMRCRAGCAALLVLFAIQLLSAREIRGQNSPFHLLEATIDDIHAAYQSGNLTARQLVQLYLDRIEAYDQDGPAINSIVNVNPYALEEASRLDAALQRTGLAGPLHGIPVIVKDQMNVAGVPTTLGSILFEDYYPDRDAFVAQKLKEAGAIILGKATLGEMGGGDTHSSLYGSTLNPYGLERTAGGSSGGGWRRTRCELLGGCVGQEGFASIRRPATWNSVVGLRPTAGLVSRGGVYDGWPLINGSLGPMARTVSDVTRLLDAMVGYDADDPITARGVGQVPETYTAFLDPTGLSGARIGILRESMGSGSEPDSEDFAKVAAVFDRAVRELRSAGAEIVDPIVIPDLRSLLDRRANAPGQMAEAFEEFFGRSASRPFDTLQDMIDSPGFADVFIYARNRLTAATNIEDFHGYLLARDELMTQFLKILADNDLDAVVTNSVEHQPTLIAEGVNPPYVNTKGVPHLNTFLVFVPALAVPAGFTSDGLPAGITFIGRPYDEATMIRLGYGYEQATRHRRPPNSTPPLPNEP